MSGGKQPKRVKRSSQAKRKQQETNEMQQANRGSAALAGLLIALAGAAALRAWPPGYGSGRGQCSEISSLFCSLFWCPRPLDHCSPRSGPAAHA